MKQTEKLDQILRWLYDHRHEPGYWEVEEICKELGMQYSYNEPGMFGKRLEDDGLVNRLGTLSGASIEINTYGIDYVEHDSYSKRGVAIAETHYHYNVQNSTNTAFVQHASNVSINQDNTNQIRELLDAILAAVRSENVSTQKLQEIEESLEEIKSASMAGVAPKFAYRALLSAAADISSVGQLVVSLGQCFGL